MKNQYPEQLRPGAVFPTVAMFTNATHYVACPKCGSDAGYYCAAPSGRKTNHPHDARMVEFQRIHPDLVKLSSLPMGTFFSITGLTGDGK